MGISFLGEPGCGFNEAEFPAPAQILALISLAQDDIPDKWAGLVSILGNSKCVAITEIVCGYLAD